MNYSYSALNLLDKNDTIERTFETVYVCGYKINTSAMIPFLQYLLYKNNCGLTFPSFKYTNTSTIINDTIIMLSFLFKNPSINCKYTGYLTMDEDLYLFFDISNETITGPQLWFSLIDEIINYNNICNFQIESVVSTLFLNNNPLKFTHLCILLT